MRSVAERVGGTLRRGLRRLVVGAVLDQQSRRVEGRGARCGPMTFGDHRRAGLEQLRLVAGVVNENRDTALGQFEIGAVRILLDRGRDDTATDTHRAARRRAPRRAPLATPS